MWCILIPGGTRRGEPGDRPRLSHRQKRNVLVHKFVCRERFEAKIDLLIDSKRQLADDFLSAAERSILTGANRGKLLRLVALDLDAAWRRAPGNELYGFRPMCGSRSGGKKAARENGEARQKGRVISPVAIEGRLIASTFWGRPGARTRDYSGL